ncbi:uracil-xanthine permease family protein [Stutzerimonas tarimensis]|uniref:Uracil-xanthine permease family protein n=1 Tax=Stutzerimonas tarimensis TaxID=1507735 RepID=A0ABV7T2J8_9GAMM
MKSALDRLFPLPSSRVRQRPDEIVYNIEDRPPLPVVLGMGLQHALLALIFALYAVIAGQAIGLNASQTAAFVSATVLVMGLATLLQAIPSRFGAGMLLVTIPGAGRLPIYIAITLHYGVAATMGATLVSGVMAIAMARVMPRLRPFFPPEVIGVVLLMMGVSLVTGGVSRSVGFHEEAADFSLPAALAAGVTLACMVGVAVWGSAALRRLALVVGGLAGTLVTWLTGNLPAGHALDMTWVALPVLGLDLPTPEFHLVPIVVIALAQFITIMDQFGSTMTMDRMTDAHWRRADMPGVARAITGMGLSHLLFGLLGTLPGGSASANIGLAHASGIAARRVGVAAGLMLITAAFFPPLAGLLALTPAPVIGGILLYTAAYMITTGIDLITSRMMDARRSFTVGLAVVIGTAVMLVPQLGQQAPDWIQVIVQSGLTMGSLAAVALNATFRIGTRKTVVHALAPACEAQQAVEALEHDGKLWGVRRDTVLRAGHAIGEALEALRASGVRGPVQLTLSFDEFNLVGVLTYQGVALQIGATAAPDVSRLLDTEEETLDAAMRQLSAHLIGRLADQVQSGQKGGQAELRLSFTH